MSLFMLSSLFNSNVINNLKNLLTTHKLIILNLFFGKTISPFLTTLSLHMNLLLARTLHANLEHKSKRLIRLSFSKILTNRHCTNWKQPIIFSLIILCPAHHLRSTCSQENNLTMQKSPSPTSTLPPMSIIINLGHGKDSKLLQPLETEVSMKWLRKM